MSNPYIVILDAATLGEDIDFSIFDKFGKVEIYQRTTPCEVAQRVENCDVIIVNKIKLNKATLGEAKRLKLICVTATGFDNIDLKYCRENNIAVCNVKGYSTDSVAQVTVSAALSLANHLAEYNRFVRDGSYTKSGVQNCLIPVFHELRGKTWGVVGMGAIGTRVAELASAFGCKVIAFKQKPIEKYECVKLDELCERSDIISIHLPLNENTCKIIDERKISLMKNTAIVINAARGAVVDEAALCRAILENRIGAVGVDVYSVEPMEEDSPYAEIADRDNVLLTPHMAWGAYEARVRCMEEILKNIEGFLNGEKRNRVE